MSAFTSHYDPDVDQIRAVLQAVHSQGEGNWPVQAADALAAFDRILLSRRNAICTIRRLRELPKPLDAMWPHEKWGALIEDEPF